MTMSDFVFYSYVYLTLVTRKVATKASIFQKMTLRGPRGLVNLVCL
jgi:hypothetical protein